jgi:hypothetical protein
MFYTSIGAHYFHNCVHVIHPQELEIKDNTESDKFASYLDIFYLILTPVADWKLHYMTNVIILTLQSSTFLFYVVTYHFRLLYLISTKGAWRVWPVSRGCLLLLGTWSYLRICRRSALPYTRFCNCLWDYISHINFAIFYYTYYENKTLRQQTAINFVTPREREKWEDGENNSVTLRTWKQ